MENNMGCQENYQSEWLLPQTVLLQYQIAVFVVNYGISSTTVLEIL